METSTEVTLRMKVVLNTTLKYFRFFNGSIGLTDMELRILAALVDTEGDLCSTAHRIKTADGLGMSLPILNTYIKRLKDKKALTLNYKQYELARIFRRTSRVEITILR